MSLQKGQDFQKTAKQLGIESVEGMLICRGRLGNSDLDFSAKYPLILPKNHPFTDLVIADCHLRVHHNKLRCTLAELRSRYWVPSGRQQVKKVVNRCQRCRWLEGKSFAAPPPPPLPQFRVIEGKPFQIVGVDFAGPLFIKEKHEMKKVYIALFTCCSIRAVHLELVDNLYTVTFLNCMRRFCARFGTPRMMNSDNANTFKAAAKLLEKLSIDPAFQEFLQVRRVKWSFNLPRTPWWGGYFERMVGCVKRCLRKSLGNSKLTQDELCTVLTEVECTLNNRPLTYLYEELGEAVTPAHLLYGHRLSPLSEGIEPKIDPYFDHDKISRRFLHLCKLLSHFWNRWRKEYLTDLREFHKVKECKPVQIGKGDLVLIQEDSVKRGLWKVGIVEDLIIGKDGQVRGASVRKVAKGKPEFLKRPLQKLFPLEIAARDHAKKEGKDGNKIRRNELEEGRNDERRGRLEDERGSGSRSARAAARDARWKCRVMLDQ